MSQEKIVSKTNLVAETVTLGEEAEVAEAKNDPDRESYAKTVDEIKENVNVENSLVGEEAQVSLDKTNHSITTVQDVERLKSNELEEKPDGSSKFDEIIPDDKHEENATISALNDTEDVHEADKISQRVSKMPKLRTSIMTMSLDDFNDIGSFSSGSEISFKISESDSEVVDMDKFRQDFLKELDKFPNISDITLSDQTTKSSKSIKIEEPPELESQRSTGVFVDPLYDSTIMHPQEEEEDRVGESLSGSEEYVEESVTEEFSFEDFDALYQPFDMPVKPEQDHEEEQIDMLDQLITTKTLGRKLEFKIESSESDETIFALQVISEQVDQFLNDIIKQVVTYVNAEESTSIVRNKLKKNELFEKCMDLSYEISVEQYARAFLYRKTSEYFRRRHLLRYITPERHETRQQDYEKYQEACERLDKLLGEENEMMCIIGSKIIALEKEINELQVEAELEVNNFENLVKNTLMRDGKSHLEEVVERELRKIRELSKAITEVRLALIQQQHALGTLKVQIDNLENIGNGLHLADYEAIQRQAVAVSKKIEDRNRDLNRLYDRFHNSLHILTHSKLRNEMLSKKMVVLAINLKTVTHEKNHFRLGVYELKKERQKMKRQISDLSLQSGLLDMPILLHDYDETEERIEKKRKVVEELRQTQKKLEQKLKQSEKVCTTK